MPRKNHARFIPSRKCSHTYGLINTCRLLTSESWAHAFVTDAIIDNCYLSNASRERAYAFPLYIESNHEPGQIQNFSSAFRTFIDSRYEHHYTPEEILGYIYTILYAPTYRTRYAEFLRIDFPRVPFPESADHFETLSGLGWALAQAHLLRELPRSGLAAYHDMGDHTIEVVRYSPEEQAVAINKTQCFKPVPQAVWDFHIGGYQVLDKYLKSRKGRVLSLDEINHVSAIDPLRKFLSAFSMTGVDRIPAIVHSIREGHRINWQFKPLGGLYEEPFPSCRQHCT